MEDNLYSSGHLYFYCFDHKEHDHIELIPEEKFHFRYIGTRDLEGMIITEVEIPNTGLELPITKMQETEEKYKGKFRKFKK